MKTPFALAPFLLLGLASAAPPPPVPYDGPRETYPPCSATVTDHCVQTYERGVRHRLRADADAPLPELDSVAAADYPPCSAARQDRCQQRSAVRRYAPAPATRYAMAERRRLRIGERG
ncbi:MAG: hypothetical protein JOZ90_16875 [Alphaproteobacteria bacterium]|nr:hypothetical protein [Alphaproteobacteria bacterium]MBV9371513.1 hypothetical protein [Alphaproteobacteria bacterium]MBV9902745.1 hypothetical protein [Alphaproteobacteria bacterium]